MHSEKFRINTNGQSLRNPTNGFFDMTLSVNNLNSDESDLAANNDRRSAHNALERQRRENLNNKFQQLAHVLPSLQTVRRPSKTMIVAKSLEFVTSSIKRESNFTSEIKRLREENARLKLQAEKAKNQLKEVAKNEQETQTTTSSLKRKASTDVHLSPPPTPEAVPKSNIPATKKQAMIVGTLAHPKKKRMVKQTKSAIDPNITLTPWSPIDNVKSQRDPSTISAAPTSVSTTTSTAPNITARFDTASPYTNNENNLLFFSPNTTAPYQYQDTTSFLPEMNPVLLAPYYIPSEADFSFTSLTSQAPPSSNGSPFYL